MRAFASANLRFCAAVNSFLGTSNSRMDKSSRNSFSSDLLYSHTPPLRLDSSRLVSAALLPLWMLCLVPPGVGSHNESLPCIFRGLYLYSLDRSFRPHLKFDDFLFDEIVVAVVVG
jgi:hypothetical protein